MGNKTWFKAALLLCLLVRFDLSISQSLPFKHYTTLDGLPSQTVYEAFQDRKGFMWFATSAGVSRFDGYSFFNYTTDDGLPDNEIFGFYQDVFDRIWLRSMNGKISFIVNNKVFNSQNTPSLKNLDKSSPILKITGTRDSSVLISYFGDGILKYTRKNKVINFFSLDIKRAGRYSSIYEENDGSFLIFRNGALHKLSTKKEVTTMLFGHTIKNSQRINNKYYISFEDKFSVMDTTYKFTPWIKTGSFILNICKGNNNSVWICTQKGAMNFDLHTNKLTQSYFKNNDVSFVLHDRENNIWFTTLYNGIIMFSNENIKNYTINDGLSSNEVVSITKDGQGGIIAGHDNLKITRINKARKISSVQLLTSVPDLFKISKPVIYDINVEASEMMLMTQYGLVYRNNDHVSIVTTLRGRAIAPYHKDMYIVAGRFNGVRTFSKSLVRKSGLNYFGPIGSQDQGVYNKFNIKQVYPTTSFANCIYKNDENKFWIGMDNGVICVTGNNNSTVRVDDQYPALRERIVDIKGDTRGTIFMATSNKGVAILKNDGNLVWLTKKQGLSSNLCTKIYLDSTILWVGTTTGVNRVKLDNQYRIENIHTIDASHGLPSNQVNALLVDHEEVWIGTTNGLSVMNKHPDNTKQNAPLLYITDVVVNKRSVDLLQKRQFRYTENNFKIRYVGLAYKKGDIHYKYRLVKEDNFVGGEDNSWQETRNTSVDFSLLPPGEYTFSVMAQSTRNGKWSKPVTYKLTINAPFWKTNAFIILLIVASTLLVISFWRYDQRIRKRRNIEKRKLQLAELNSLRSQMNYHFMSNAFNSLQGLFLSENNIDQYLGKFSRLMRITLEHSDRQLIPLTEELEYLKLYCDIEKLRVDNRFSFTIECDEKMDIGLLQVPSLTLQPFVENAIWHGIIPKENAGSITLKISPYDSSSFKITIEDDGIGINASSYTQPKTRRKSYGTKLIMDRFDVIQKQSSKNFGLWIEDKSEIGLTNGTRVSITFPYNYENEYEF